MNEEIVNFLFSECFVDRNELKNERENEIIYNFYMKEKQVISSQCGTNDIYNEPIITTTINERTEDFHIDYLLTEEICKKYYNIKIFLCLSTFKRRI